MKFIWLIVLSISLMVGCLVTGCGGPPNPPAKETPAKPVQIVQFYSNNATVAKGDQVLICYGVENAKAVRLEPAIEQITPSYVRCFRYAPQTSSEYKLIATGADGTEVSKTLRIEVVGVAAPAKASLIRMFDSSAKSVPAGQEVTLCYDTRNASSVKIEPDTSGRTLPVRGCVSEKVAKTTKFTLTAQGAGGKQDHESVTVSVQP